MTRKQDVFPEFLLTTASDDLQAMHTCCGCQSKYQENKWGRSF